VRVVNRRLGLCLWLRSSVVSATYLQLQYVLVPLEISNDRSPGTVLIRQAEGYVAIASGALTVDALSLSLALERDKEREQTTPNCNNRYAFYVVIIFFILFRSLRMLTNCACVGSIRFTLRIHVIVLDREERIAASQKNNVSIPFYRYFCDYGCR
jgi:hypothetical protein